MTFLCFPLWLCAYAAISFPPQYGPSLRIASVLIQQLRHAHLASNSFLSFSAPESRCKGVLKAWANQSSSSQTTRRRLSSTTVTISSEIIQRCRPVLTWPWDGVWILHQAGGGAASEINPLPFRSAGPPSLSRKQARNGICVTKPGSVHSSHWVFFPLTKVLD